MGKLKRDYLESVLNGDSCTNELVVLPIDKDVGFEEYFEFKANEVIKEKRLFTPEEQNKLILSYPHPDSKDPYIFDKFFESPSVVAKNHEYEGCFGIDISDYIGKTKDEHFQQLLKYIATNDSAVYVFIIFSNNKNESASMFQTLNEYSKLRLVDINIPKANDLVEYTVSKTRDFASHVKKPIYDYLEKYYEKCECGFETADALVQHLKSNEFAGEIDDLKQAIKQMESSGTLGGSPSGFGY